MLQITDVAFVGYLVMDVRRARIFDESILGTNAALEVADLDAALTNVRAANVLMSYGPMDSAVCRFFGTKDPDGNDITLHQRKSS